VRIVRIRTGYGCAGVEVRGELALFVDEFTQQLRLPALNLRAFGFSAIE